MWKKFKAWRIRRKLKKLDIQIKDIERGIPVVKMIMENDAKAKQDEVYRLNIKLAEVTDEN